MATEAHSIQTVSDGIHVAKRWEHASAAARTGASYTSADEGGISHQTDNDTFWLLVDSAGPTFRQITDVIAGDVTGTLAASVVTAIQGVAVQDHAPLDGEVLTYVSANTRWEPAAGGGGGGDTAKVSANDTTAGYLNGKLVASTGISFTENNDGSNETLSIAVDATASEITNTPAGNIAATDVQAAINELDGEKLGATAAASGDLSGNYPGPSVAKVQGVDVQNHTPLDGEVLTYVGANTRWEPIAPTPSSYVIDASSRIGISDANWTGPSGIYPIEQDAVWQASFGAANIFTTPADPSVAPNSSWGIPVPKAGTIKTVSIMFDNFSASVVDELWFCLIKTSHVHGGTGSDGGISTAFPVGKQLCLDNTTDGLDSSVRQFFVSTDSGSGRQLTLGSSPAIDVALGDSLIPVFAINYNASGSVPTASAVWVQVVIEEA